MSTWSSSSSKYVPPTQQNKQVTKTHDKNKFNSKKDIEENKKILNQIAGIEVGEVMAWNP